MAQPLPRLACAAIVIALGACRRDPSPSSPDPAPTGSPAISAHPSHRTVRPSATDPAIGEPDDPHEVFVPAGRPNGKLFVFLPGTHGDPANVRHNTGDKFAGHVAAAWTALGLDRLGRASVDGAAPPYGGAHELTTSIRGPTPMWAHNSVLREHPGTRFPEVWAYLIGP